jgi:8-hydroxy-5-deazaflavin:NADPH oxidoreductase
VRIGVIGAGRIGGNAARLFAAAGHEVMLSFSHEPERLAARAAEIGERAVAGTVADAAKFGDVTMLSVPWGAIPEALEQAGSLRGVVIDTTNQFAAGHLARLPHGMTGAQYNQQRIPGAALVKSFNTLTSTFQAAEAGRPAATRVVLFLCGDDAAAKAAVSGLIRDAGFEPVDVGGLADAAVMEAPRRRGSVYGEEYRPAEAAAAMAALRAGQPLPPAPTYG